MEFDVTISISTINEIWFYDDISEANIGIDSWNFVRFWRKMYTATFGVDSRSLILWSRFKSKI